MQVDDFSIEPVSKYYFMYALDVSKPPSQSRTEMIGFDSRIKLLWHALTNKIARKALFAGRWHVIHVQ